MMDEPIGEWLSEIAPQVESITIHFVGRDSVAVMTGDAFRSLVQDADTLRTLSGHDRRHE